MTSSHFEWGSELPTLTGQRLDLRPLAMQDAQALLRVFGDPEVMRYWSDVPLPEELIEHILAGFAARALFQWGVALHDGGTLIGTCTLLHVDRAHRRAEVGFALARDAWGRGLGTEALTVLMAFAFETLDLHRLEADVDPRNERSLRLLERQGFKREGYLRERWHVGGESQDAVFLGLLRTGWHSTSFR
jgi:ribosomal-protein-alanine N-acetyltransferase